MKRYLCEKNVYEEPRRSMVFKAGSIYKEANSILTGSMEMIALIDLKGNVQHFSKHYLDGHFKELEPIEDTPRDPAHVYHDQAQQYVMLNDGCVGRGIAVGIAIVLSVAAILYSILA